MRHWFFRLCTSGKEFFNMGWEKEIEELNQRAELAYRMGGEEKVARQHEFGKLSVRERITGVVDEKSFHEIGTLAGRGEYDENGELTAFTPSNFVFGTATIDGRTVVVSGDDFTVRGGSSDASIAGKRIRAEGFACELKLPHVRLIDGMAGGGSVKTIEMAGRTYIPELRGWELVINHLGIAPSVSLALGSAAGLGAARIATSHYSVIVADTAQMMVAGPALVDWARLGKVSKEELGHARIHTRNGAIDDEAKTEIEAFDMARRFLSYLPTNIDELPPVIDVGDSTGRRDQALLDIIPRDPRKPYTMRSIIAAVVDKGSFFEIGRKWGESIITGFARLGGIPVALFAEDPNYYGGAWTADSCRKLTRFIDLSSTFHLPLIHLEDCPGFLIGKEAEETATIRYGVQTLAALGQSAAPYCCIVVRKAFGVAGSANQKAGSHHFRYAWPSGDWGSLPIEGGIEVAYKAELAAAKDYDAHLAMIKERLNRLRSPFRSAEYFEVDEIIDPRDTRPILCRWAVLARKAMVPGRQMFTFRP
jgi:acetyl-CoA carboxylase carboxyltransferase component